MIRHAKLLAFAAPLGGILAIAPAAATGAKQQQVTIELIFLWKSLPVWRMAIDARISVQAEATAHKVEALPNIEGLAALVSGPVVVALQQEMLDALEHAPYALSAQATVGEDSILSWSSEQRDPDLPRVAFHGMEVGVHAADDGVVVVVPLAVEDGQGCGVKCDKIMARHETLACPGAIGDECRPGMCPSLP